MFPLQVVTAWQSRSCALTMLRVAGSALTQSPYSTAWPLHSAGLGAPTFADRRAAPANGGCSWTAGTPPAAGAAFAAAGLTRRAAISATPARAVDRIRRVR